MNPRRIVRLYEWYKAKTFCCAFFAAAMLTMVAAATIVRFPPVHWSSIHYWNRQPLCISLPIIGPSQWIKPQCRNNTARSPYGGHTVALRWPWGGIWFLPCLGCLENRTAASRRPSGDLTVPLRRPCGKFVVAATTARSPHGHLPASLRSPYGF